MARLLVAWSRPHHLSSAEARDWLFAESHRLLELPAIARLELTELDAASDAYGRCRDWLLEAHLVSGPNGTACADEPSFAEWLCDLRLLGMRPVVVLAERSVVLEREQG